jgi:ribosomal protein S12 methylthiotransferase
MTLTTLKPAPIRPRGKAPKVGVVSLGCPKALVDSERIMTRLRSEGYQLVGDYSGADLVLVNTCGFLDSARAESLDAIGEALAENGKVIVTGCLGAEPDVISKVHPSVLAITGPQQYESVMEAVHAHLAPVHDPYTDLVPEAGLKLTPRHYAYLKISEGCNNRCSFCIIPALRGDLVSRPIHAVLREAEALAKSGVKELLVISQDTSAYGVDVKYAPHLWREKEYRTKFYDLCEGLGELGLWVRLHYVYPYPHVDEVIPLMAEGKILPYLDIPFQHAHPDVLSAMKRPAKQDRILERIAQWRRDVPDMTVRSTFIVGFPGETENQFEYLLDWLEEARIDRAGVFKYENVDGAQSKLIEDQVEEEDKHFRWERFMETQARISATRAEAQVGRTLDVLIDEVGEDGLIGRTKSDAPEIDGQVHFPGATGAEPGDIVRAHVLAADEYDLEAEIVD